MDQWIKKFVIYFMFIIPQLFLMFVKESHLLEEHELLSKNIPVGLCEASLSLQRM